MLRQVRFVAEPVSYFLSVDHQYHQWYKNIGSLNKSCLYTEHPYQTSAVCDSIFKKLNNVPPLKEAIVTTFTTTLSFWFNLASQNGASNWPTRELVMGINRGCNDSRYFTFSFQYSPSAAANSTPGAYYNFWNGASSENLDPTYAQMSSILPSVFHKMVLRHMIVKDEEEQIYWLGTLEVDSMRFSLSVRDYYTESEIVPFIIYRTLDYPSAQSITLPFVVDGVEL